MYFMTNPIDITEEGQWLCDGARQLLQLGDAKYVSFELSDEPLQLYNRDVPVFSIRACTENALIIDDWTLVIDSVQGHSLHTLLQLNVQYWMRVYPRETPLVMGYAHKMVWYSPHLHPNSFYQMHDWSGNLVLERQHITRHFHIDASDSLYQLELTDRYTDSDAIEVKATKGGLVYATGHRTPFRGLESMARLLMRPGQPYYLSLWQYEELRYEGNES